MNRSSKGAERVTDALPAQHAHRFFDARRLHIRLLYSRLLQLHVRAAFYEGLGNSCLSIVLHAFPSSNACKESEGFVLALSTAQSFHSLFIVKNRTETIANPLLVLHRISSFLLRHGAIPANKGTCEGVEVSA